MFIDEVNVIFKGGNGGDGIVSFGKTRKSGPDGGNGGDGGDLYLIGSSDLTLLNQFSRKKLLKAESGQPGGRNKRTGGDGKDLTIEIPIGTSVMDDKRNIEVVEINKVGQKILICKGGKGGLGNFEFRSSTNITPKFAERGTLGDILTAKLILKLIADFGFVGLPNAGKSSLLNELTGAKAKTANYNFTTLYPNLGVMKDKILADIPGLIEGASKGRGLGISFLKHIEKVNTLIHCISSESTKPQNDYETIRNEMGSYNPSLLTKHEIVLITKSDLTNDKKIKKIIKSLNTKNKEILATSIYDYDSLEKLKERFIRH